MSIAKLASCLNGHDPTPIRHKQVITGRIDHHVECDCTRGPIRYSEDEAGLAWNAHIRKLVEQSVPKESK